MASKKIGIIGYGVIGRQIEEFILEQAIEEVVFFYFDDILQSQGKVNSFPFSTFKNPEFSDLDFYIGLGYHHLVIKNNVYEQLRQHKLNYPPFIHHTAYVHPAAEIANGVIIFPMCNVGTSVVISEGVLVNNSSVISHDSIIGRCSFISPGVVLSGRVKIGEFCFIGTGSVIANDLAIGNNVRIGIGTVVAKNVEDDLSVIGNPMKIINRLIIK